MRGKKSAKSKGRELQARVKAKSELIKSEFDVTGSRGESVHLPCGDSLRMGGGQEWARLDHPRSCMTTKESGVYSKYNSSH